MPENGGGFFTTEGVAGQANGRAERMRVEGGMSFCLECRGQIRSSAPLEALLHPGCGGASFQRRSCGRPNSTRSVSFPPRGPQCHWFLSWVAVFLFKRVAVSTRDLGLHFPHQLRSSVPHSQELQQAHIHALHGNQANLSDLQQCDDPCLNMRHQQNYLILALIRKSCFVTYSVSGASTVSQRN